MNVPKISIIISNYNHGPYLEEALLPYAPEKDIEVIFVDDASTDNSVEIVERLLPKIPCLRFFCNKENKGVIAAQTIAISHSSAPYIHIQGADDFRDPQWITTMLDLIKRKPHVSLFCSNGVFLIDGKLVKETSLEGIEEQFFDPKQACALFKNDTFWIPGHTAIFKKDSFMRHGKLIPSLFFAADWYVIHAIALAEGFYYKNHDLTIQRRVVTSYGSGAKAKIKTKVWLSLLACLDKNPALASSFYQSTILWVLGIKAPFFSFLIRPKRYGMLALILMKKIRMKRKKNVMITAY